MRSPAVNCLLFLVVFIVCGCGPQVTFREPQPAGKQALEHIPGRLLGTYISADGITTIHVTPQTITSVADYDVKVHKDSLGREDLVLRGDSIINTQTHASQKAEIIGDSVNVHIHYVDTVFHISPQNVLKKMKGYYFMNNEYDSGRWWVKKLWLSHGHLLMGDIEGEESIKNLRDITETTSDTISTDFQPTRRQFMQFMQDDGFSTIDSFIKVKADR